MNTLNAFIFTAMGSAMGLVPVLFPAWIMTGGSDASGARALWLGVMAVAQVGLGLGYIAQAHVFPFVARLLSTGPEADSGAFVLPKQRVISGR